MNSDQVKWDGRGKASITYKDPPIVNMSFWICDKSKANISWSWLGHLLMSGWQKLHESAKGLCRKVWIRTLYTISCRNIKIRCDLCIFWKTLGKKKCFLGGGQEVHYYMAIWYICICRGDICQCRHRRRQCKIFVSGVNFSRNNVIYNINESTKYILPWFHP